MPNSKPSASATLLDGIAPTTGDADALSILKTFLGAHSGSGSVLARFEVEIDTFPGPSGWTRGFVVTERDGDRYVGSFGFANGAEVAAFLRGVRAAETGTLSCVS